MREDRAAQLPASASRAGCSPAACPSSAAPAALRRGRGWWSRVRGAEGAVPGTHLNQRLRQPLCSGKHNLQRSHMAFCFASSSFLIKAFLAGSPGAEPPASHSPSSVGWEKLTAGTDGRRKAMCAQGCLHGPSVLVQGSSMASLTAEPSHHRHEVGAVKAISGTPQLINCLRHAIKT